MKVLWIVLVVSSVISAENIEGSREYCFDERFEAECGDNEVLMLDSAYYGRMYDGRCVSDVLSHIAMGCSLNALPYIDSLCSGKRSCSFLIATLIEVIPKELLPCPKYVNSFLDANYTCVKVNRLPVEKCAFNSTVLLPNDKGFIASNTNQQIRQNYKNCQFRIQADPGQRVNIKIIDFQTAENSVSSCVPYVQISEPGSLQQVTVCQGHERENSVFTSKSNLLDLRLLSNDDGSTNGPFLIEYDFIGCPDIIAPKNGWLRRNVSTAVWGCNNKMEEKFTIHCNGTAWENEVGKCSGTTTSAPIAATTTRKQNHKEVYSKSTEEEEEKVLIDMIGISVPPKVLSLIFVVSVGLLLGTILILICGCACIYRQKKRHEKKLKIISNIHYPDYRSPNDSSVFQTLLGDANTVIYRPINAPPFNVHGNKTPNLSNNRTMQPSGGTNGPIPPKRYASTPTQSPYGTYKEVKSQYEDPIYGPENIYGHENLYGIPLQHAQSSHLYQKPFPYSRRDSNDNSPSDAYGSNISIQPYGSDLSINPNGSENPTSPQYFVLDPELVKEQQARLGTIPESQGTDSTTDTYA